MVANAYIFKYILIFQLDNLYIQVVDWNIPITNICKLSNMFDQVTNSYIPFTNSFIQVSNMYAPIN